MAKRGYKLRCFILLICIGKKTSRLFITGGDDYKVNLWAIGKPTSLMWFELLLDIDPIVLLLASGSNDANLKLWDIRKKGCIQTYKGHTRGINTIRFTTDGRWVVSGGLDNVVKIITAFSTKESDNGVRWII